MRTTLQALAAVLGGTQSLHTNGFDEALGLPTEAAARLALRTQQMIAHESGVADTVDPLAGSYYVEALTDEIEARAKIYLKTIDGFDKNGAGLGMLRAIEQGYIQREIQRSSYAHQRAVDAGEVVVVGGNRFVQHDPLSQAGAGGAPRLRMDEGLERRQVERLRALRERREKGRWEHALRGVEEAARTGENVMPRILEAVEGEATVGEIADALRLVFGEFHESVVI